MDWVVALVLAAALAYGIRALLLLYGSWRELQRSRHLPPLEAQVPSVSVIIPARNEEHTIAHCVASVAACPYPRLEILVVNDRSTDNTAAVLEQLQQRYPIVRVFTRESEPDNPNLRGKAGALHLGALHASGELLLFTDADCTVPPSWVSELARCFADPTVGLVASFTLIRPQGLFAWLQSAEWLLLHTAGSAGVGLGHALGCFGNNLAVRARTYWDIGGYERIPFSVTEDLALQQAVQRAGWRLRYHCARESLVWTLPAPTLRDYLRQRRRWARGGLQLGWRGIAFVLPTLLLWGALISALASGHLLEALLLGLLRMGADLLLGLPSLLRLRQYGLLGVLPLTILLLALVELLLPVLVLSPQIRWKGQALR